MIQKARHVDPNPGRFIIVSLAIHLAVLVICSYTEIFKPVLHETAPYYVDIVSLPTLAPAPSNQPSPAAATKLPPMPAAPPHTAPAAAKQPAPPAKPIMALPAKTAPTSPAARPVQDAGGQDAKEFAQRMSRLEYNADAKHQADALDSLQKRIAAKKAAGGATASGSDKGAEYGAYIQSRLKDALATTMVYRSKAPEAAVHLYINKKGKLVRYVMERPSADKLFNDSVIRTIEKAKGNFPPTPTTTGYDKLYVFNPQEVTNK